MYKVTFLPDGRQSVVEEGESLLDAVKKAGIYIHSLCGGEGTCGRCKVIVKKGKYRSKPSPHISEEEAKKGYVLACQTYPEGDLEVEIPLESRIEGVYAVEDVALKSELKVKPEVCNPLSKKLFLKLPAPTLQDNISDADRLLRQLRGMGYGEVKLELGVVRKLGAVLRESEFEVTATLAWDGDGYRAVEVEGGRDERNFGVAVDVGTTTIVAQLVDLAKCEALGTKATYNKQARYGEDVITRIIHAEKGGLEELHDSVVNDINELIGALCAEAGIGREEITAVVCAGNTTMTHLLLGVNPAFIRKEPYIPTFSFPPPIKAREIGVEVNPNGMLYCLPSVASFVGGDITAGVLATGMARDERLSMLIDMGTNGEIVFGNSEFLVCCSCSAGPAFEGGGIEFGMRASRGAIQRVEVTPDLEVRLSTVGNARPRGICGSGMIDCLAEFLENGIINKAGKFNAELRSKTRRLREGGEGLEFVLAWADESGLDRDIVLTQADIDNLIRSKAAVYAGAKVLLDKIGFDFESIERFYVAGGFGSYLDIGKAIAIGLLPDLPQERFEYIGNSSLAGARLCLLSEEAFKEALEIASKMTYIELSVDTAFYDQFVAELFLPHTDQ
ncbi:ferredoxin [Candidatus Poribacteria bacterium]|nr:MAG: ferredoxin [Candidatus Poribacteria bacterium]